MIMLKTYQTELRLERRERKRKNIEECKYIESENTKQKGSLQFVMFEQTQENCNEEPRQSKDYKQEVTYIFDI